MAVELVMPRLSESMQEGTVVAWLIGDGQLVEQGQEIAEIESDMSTVAWVAPETGVLRILVPAGSRLRIGQPIGLIDDLTPLPGAATSSGDLQRSPAWGPAPQAGWRAPQHEEEDEGETTEFAAVEEQSAEPQAAPQLVDEEFEPATQEHSAVVVPPQPPVPPVAPAAPQPVAPPGGHGADSSHRAAGQPVGRRRRAGRARRRARACRRSGALREP